MPLQDHIPVIDDRSYASIVNEVRSRIPRYTPEWSNLNETDPGIILSELFAWMTEMQIFRMAQVPQLNYIKFLEMIGIELEPSRAASGVLTMDVNSSHSAASVILPAKTQFSSAEPDEQGRIVFEADQAVNLLRARLANLLVDDGFNYRDVSNDNADANSAFQPFGPTAVRDTALMFGFDEELPELQFTLSAWTPQVNEQLVVSQCYSETRVNSSTRIAWEFWNGREWRPLTLLKDDSAALTRSGDILLQGPESGQMAAQTFGDISDARFWIRMRVDAAGFDEAPRISAIRGNSVRVTQAQTYEYESVGGSNGEIDQQLRLRNAQVLAGSLALEIDEGAGHQQWTEVADFYASGDDDPHYVLNRGTGEIRFGDGRNGRVPVANAGNPANIRARVYRAGGGKRGNLGAGKISKLLDSVRGIDGRSVTNLFAAAGGADEQELDEAIKSAPQQIKSQDRAVTAEDYQELALKAANIARAHALPLYHPDYPGIEVPGVVSVIVIPDVESDAPMPSQGTLQAVCDYLNQRRLLTTELHVMGPSYREVVVRAELVAEDTADLAQVKSSALDALNLYFDPIKGGEDSDATLAEDDLERSGGGWPFGGDIYYSLLYRRLLGDGVKRIVSLSIEVDGELYPECRDVPLDAGLLLRNGSHAIDVNYEVAQ